jgi:alpha-D-xyloside xylohydrolase
MQSTNYQLFDFLDFDINLKGKERLWRACKPNSYIVEDNDIIISIPFQKQIYSNEIKPDLTEKRKEYKMRLRAYGDKIVRMSIGFGVDEMLDSPMLEIDKNLKIFPLNIENNDNEWIIKDIDGKKRACINFKPYNTEHWSDLLPGPDETIDLKIYPDGKKEIELSAYDQFFPARHDAFALAYIERNNLPDSTTFSLHTNHDEIFVGSGERFRKLDLSGQTFRLKNQDGQGVNNRRTYKNIPFFISSRMYGLFIHTSAYGKISFADYSTRSLQVFIEQPLIDIFIFGGETIDEIIFQYRQITGFPSLPPLWSYGIWMSRMTYFSADEVNNICERLRKEDFPCDVIHLDTGWFKTDWLCEWKFNPERFPNPEKFMNDLKSKGFRVSLWQMPYIAQKAEQHDEAVKNNYIGKINKARKRGDSDFSALDYAGTIDFTYPKAVEWYKELLRKLLKLGAACIKTDFGEDIHMDAEYYAMKPELLNNLYSLLYQKAAFEVTKETTGNGIIWARAGWAGCQRYPVHWGGDSASTWDGMAGSLKGGLHLGLSGFAFWSHDVPGFHGVPDFMNSKVSDDIYVRWTQFGVFTSHIRYHGTSKREPFYYTNISDIVRKWWKLRYCIIPYIYEQSKKCISSGFPILRALIFHNHDDLLCWHIHDEYYFGDDFLVAPIMNSDNKRDVYLPKGKWINFFTGKIFEGPEWIKNYKLPLEIMPLFVKYGAKIPVYPEHISCTDEIDFKKSKILIFDDSYKGVNNSVIGKLISFNI